MRKVIEIKDLHYTYPDGTPALKGVNLDILEGESVALVGHNGAGKSTLLLHLNGILRGNGSLRILGMEPDGRNTKEIRNRVGVIFQDPDDQLFSATVFDDVAFGPMNMGCTHDDVKERVRRALEQVDLRGYEERCPHRLSLGEKKRVSIATVLSMDPEILILDEPTSNMDPKSRRRLMKFLQGLHHTKIIATHDMDMVWEICERTILLSEGQVIANGRTKELLTNIGLLDMHGLEPPPAVRFSRGA